MNRQLSPEPLLKQKQSLLVKKKREREKEREQKSESDIERPELVYEDVFIGLQPNDKHKNKAVKLYNIKLFCVFQDNFGDEIMYFMKLSKV